MDPQEQRRRVIEYYEKSRSGYRLFWYGRNDRAMHYGFWDAKTRRRSHALLNENIFLAGMAHVKKEDSVLDAGCGVGGSTLWLAKNIGCRVVGISVTPSDIEDASRYAKRAGVFHSVRFELQDYSKTNFADGTFDVVWAIESFCHAPDKKVLFSEMYRVLKPGGRIIIADGFQKRRTRDRNEEDMWKSTMRGLGVYQTQWWDEYGEFLGDAGFMGIIRHDMSRAVRPTVCYTYWLGMMFSPLALILLVLEKLFHRDSVMLGNWRSALLQRRTFESGLWIYGVYYAEKAR